jgi:cyclophilin family peptidyl-prolyl cis-trans isomerase
MKRNRLGAIGPLIAALLFAGCATTQVTSSWKDSGYRKMPHKILAVALVKNKENRTALEDEFALQLRNKGLDVTAGNTVFPVRTPSNKDELEKYLRDNGYDTLLLVRVVAEKDLLEHIPDKATTWTSSYSTGDNTKSSPEYVVQQRIAMAEANLYDVETEKLFWTAASQTSIDKVNRALIADYVTQILKQMQKNGVVR